MSAEVGLWVAASAAWWAMLACGIAFWHWRWAPRSTEARHAIFAVAILAGACAPLFPRWGDGLIRVPNEAAPPTAASFVQDHPSAAPATPAAWEPMPATTTRNSTELATRSMPVEAQTRTFSFSIPWMWLIVGVWAAGFSLHAARLAVAARVHRRWRNEAQPLPATEHVLFEQCLTALDVRRRVQAGIHEHAPTPLVLCGWRPLVLAPTGWLARPIAEKRAAWRHELSHVRRRDDWWRLLSETLRTVWWWHPGVHWLLARREFEAELLSDEAAASTDCPPRDLARLLIEACQESPPTYAHPAASFAAFRSLKRRVARLATAESLEELRRPAPRGLRAFSMVGAVLLVFAGSMRLVAASQMPPTPLPPAADKAVAVSATQNVAKIVVKLVDADTGELLKHAHWQWGLANPEKKNEFIWGNRGQHNSRADGTFEMTFDLGHGSRWVRFVAQAAGYDPVETVEEVPSPTPDLISRTVKLRRGPSITGTLRDHGGRPVANGWVFFIPAGHKTRIVGGIPGGHTEERPGAVSRDHAVAEVRTDANGRFALPAGTSGKLAASTDLVDLWPFSLPKSGDSAELTMPAPGYVAIDLSYWYIDHEFQEGKETFSSDTEDPNQCWILVYRLGRGDPLWDAFDDYRRVLFAFAKNARAPLTKGVTVGAVHEGQWVEPITGVGLNRNLTTKVNVPLPPGTYSIQRLRAGAGGFAPIDDTTVTVTAGGTTPLGWARGDGAAVRGAVKMPGNVKFVQKAGEAARELDWTVPQWQFVVIRSADGKVRDAAKIHKDGGFFVATHLEPGRYRAETVISLPSDGLDRGGLAAPPPEVHGSQEFVVPEPLKNPAGSPPVEVEVKLQLQGKRVSIADANAAKPTAVVRAIKDRTMEVADRDPPVAGSMVKVSGKVGLPTGLLFRRQVAKVAVIGPNPRPVGFKGVSVDPVDGRVVEELSWKHVKRIDVHFKANDGRDFSTFVKADESGGFAIPISLPPGGYQVDAAAILDLDDADQDRFHEPDADLHASTELIRVKPGDTESITVALKLHAAGFSRRLREDDPAKRRATFSGKLTHGGKPVAGVKVLLYGGIATRWEIARTETDANGSYGFENLAGSVTSDGKESSYYIGVQFVHPSLVPADGKSWRDVTVSTKPGTAEKLNLELADGGFIEGNARRNVGIRMYIPAKAGVRRGSTLFHAYASADAQGRFHSPPLFPGQYFVEENAGDYPLVGEVKVEAGKTTTVGGK
jgi:beta-lactamase regulating signal transducer with metallopeptidase domain